ncbi:FAD-dependent oxidoreductase [Oceanispirochaeta sp. M2]|nr:MULTISPECIES: FAD-dependent oxidoreductase [unclassified Oceanispirochaeta]MBF9015098.1 FAD-dependent oxidoreductase [Oceanispirochaeta sp. M2]NPD71556.1 FAD-dependent oxidoreductase [Oceanispirochaeta sp. M1]RDG33224.1 FAD-dependent oxidoreductase [Oceanispirochaeta sp. M1]
MFRESVQLKGSVDSWEQKVQAGQSSAGHGFKGVLNDILVSGCDEPGMSQPQLEDDLLEGRSFDVVIVGGGVIGCAIARELCRLELTVAVLEKEADLAMQASGRNDGMIHPGFAAKPGSLKSHYNTRGNRLYTNLAEELGFNFTRPGTIILFKDWWMRFLLPPIFKKRCRDNGVDGDYRTLSQKEVKKHEPNVTKRQKGGFLLPSTGIVSPFQVTIALAENAVANGAEVFLNTLVCSVFLDEGRVSSIETNRGRLRAGVLINAAGVWSDKLAEMADDRFFSIHGRKGTDAILDRNSEGEQNHILGMPSFSSNKKNHSKGGGLVLCVEGNILLGPTAEEVSDREDYSTDSEMFTTLLEQLEMNTKLSPSMIINYYSGVRAASWEEDFIVEPSDKVANLVHAAAIQSPGFASAPAIAVDVASMAVDILRTSGVDIVPRDDFNPVHHGIPQVKNMNAADRDTLIKRDPAYGEILCRCEEVSRGEIRDALHSAVPAATVDGIKRRVRAGAGRCHGGFCLPKVILTMAREMNVPIIDITRKGSGSNILVAETKISALEVSDAS